MKAIRLFSVVFIFLLAACAPKPPAFDAPLNNFEPPSSSGSNLSKGEQDLAEDSSTKLKPSSKDKLSTETQAPANKKNFAAASKIGAWEISGAMAARSKNKGWSASLNWLQRGQGRYQIRLSGPLGGGTVLISKDGGLVTLRDGPKSVSSPHADSLLKQQTGVRLPVASLYYWVRGIAAPGSIQGERRDQSGRLTQLRQAGYLIEYLQYTAVGKAILPSSIKLQGNGIFIKLIIKRWRI